MEAKRLIGQATYDPETLSVLFRAFDEAWLTVAPKCGGNPLAVSAARLKLANAILSQAREGAEDVATIRDGALGRLGGI